MTQWPFLDDNDAKCLSRDSFFLIPNKVDSCFWENFVVFFYCVCPLCNRSEIGDEFHYLLKCTHSSLSHIRGIFLESLYSINSNFTNMSCKALFLYIMSMCDQNILNLSASYIENILILMHPNSNIKLFYHTSSVEAVHSKVKQSNIFSFMMIFNCSFLSYLTFITFFICYCFGKSIKLLLLLFMWEGKGGLKI